MNQRSSMQNIDTVQGKVATVVENDKGAAESSLENTKKNSFKLVDSGNDELSFGHLSEMGCGKNIHEFLKHSVEVNCTGTEEMHDCICGLSVKREVTKSHNCINELRQIVEKQSSRILGLQESLKKLRKYVRITEKRHLERDTEYRAGMNEKYETLSENLSEVMMRDTRRCSGRCRKHVQTEKCLCRGFTTAAPHVCCGRQGGTCDC